MVTKGINICHDCGGTLRPIGKVKRILKGKRGILTWINIRRLSCSCCGKVHRELPTCLLPYKHYERNIIQGVIMGVITSDDLEYEDFPSEMTMMRWKKLHF